MKIVYLHQYFRTPSQGGAIRSYYLAKSLIEVGHEVELVTSHNKPIKEVRMVEGIKVHYLPVSYHNSFGFFGRIWAFIKFIFSAYKEVEKIQNIDYCYASSTPLTIGIVALWIKRNKGIPYFFEVRDLWPEAPIQMGVIRNGLIKKYLYKLESTIYQNADSIIALSPGIRDGIEKVMPTASVSFIPNMADCEFFNLEGKNKELEAKYRVSNKFVISYFGAIGKVNYLESLLQMAEFCERKNLPIEFLVAGDGGQVEHLEKLVEKKGLKTVQFIGYLDKYGIKDLLSVTDASYISFAQKPVLQTNSPNKFFDSIAAGKLCIVNNEGWIKDIIQQKDCGFYYDVNHPEDFENLILPYINNPIKLLEAQTNARKLAEQFFSRKELTKNFTKLFSNDQEINPVISSVYTLTA